MSALETIKNKFGWLSLDSDLGIDFVNRR